MRTPKLEYYTSSKPQHLYRKYLNKLKLKRQNDKLYKHLSFWH